MNMFKDQKYKQKRILQIKKEWNSNKFKKIPRSSNLYVNFHILLFIPMFQI
jgi:hypothetical protein